MTRAVVACLLVLAGLARAEPAVRVEQITWLAGDTLAMREPGGIQRPSDRMIDWLAPRLPGVTQKRLVANAKRSWMLIGSGEPMCHAGTVRTPEREKLAHFSNTWLMPPVQLVVRRDHLALLPLDAAGQVDLAALLADTRRRGVLVQGRSYGPALDGLLAQRSANPEVREITSGDFGSNLVPMLRRGHVDYLFEYPNVLAAVTENGGDMAELTTVPIRGAADPVVSGVACPRTPWGQAAIRLVDAALGTPEGAAMLRDGLMARLPPDTARTYRAQLDSFFQRRSQPTPGL